MPEFLEGFESKYPATMKAVYDIERLANTLTNEEAGTTDANQTADKLRDAFLEAVKNPTVQAENRTAIDSAKSHEYHDLFSAILLTQARSEGLYGQKDGCPDYALLQAKMYYDYFAKPQTTSLSSLTCAAGQISKIEVLVPYESPLDTHRTNKNIDAKP